MATGAGFFGKGLGRLATGAGFFGKDPGAIGYGACPNLLEAPSESPLDWV
ncbi:hypothetical protein [Corynebacterium auriscanis]|nr:hypothetical protein [Corynebacterium auriscanis]